tara:strand:+ start:82 stop:288 length:207 start_codon:yes stop_codon:yes gene_type:complete
MNINKAIVTAQNKLIKTAKRKGIYDNFGQKEISKLENKYIDISNYTDDMNKNRELIYNFSNWCENYTI